MKFIYIYIYFINIFLRVQRLRIRRKKYRYFYYSLYAMSHFSSVQCLRSLTNKGVGVKENHIAAIAINGNFSCYW